VEWWLTQPPPKHLQWPAAPLLQTSRSLRRDTPAGPLGSGATRSLFTPSVDVADLDRDDVTESLSLRSVDGDGGAPVYGEASRRRRSSKIPTCTSYGARASSAVVMMASSAVSAQEVSFRLSLDLEA